MLVFIKVNIVALVVRGRRFVEHGQVKTKIALARAKKHWTQEEAAEKCGVSVNTINNWEKGSVRPFAYNIVRICEVYGMSEEELGLAPLVAEDAERLASGWAVNGTGEERCIDGARLEMARQHKGLSQEKLAAVVQVNVSTIGRWLGGECIPRPVHMHRLCEVLDLTPEDLLISVKSVVPAELPLVLPPSESKYIQAFLKHDLTMRLESLTSHSYQSYEDIHHAMTRILKDYDKMNSKNQHINRRKALLRLTTLPFAMPGIAAAFASEETPSATASKDILAQCTVSIGACWELRKSSEYSDVVLAFEGVSAYLPVLQRIVKDSSEHRKEAASLVTQCFLLKSFLAQHLEGMREAMQYAQQALLYSEAARDISLRLKAFDRLVVAYFHSKRYQQALQTIKQAEPLLKQKSTSIPLHLQARIHGQLAYTLSGNGQDGSAHLDQAIILHPGTDKECPMYVNYEKSDLLRDAGTTYMLQGESAKAVETFSQVIDPKTLVLKMSWTELGRIETINAMTMALLKAKDKNMEQTLHFWMAGIEGARALHSEERFNEALYAYEIMGYIWPGEARIQELRDLTQHW